ncbi:MAG: flagellar protein FlgN [Thermodesulfovibrionales bacterium]|nr:flagellar protein FlgN [Thermodesulfovibrionales bacterium]
MNTKDSLRVIITELISGYYVLQTLLQRERENLINLNIPQIEALSKEKDTVLMRLRLLEEERKRLLRNYFIEREIRGDLERDLVDKILMEEESLKPLLLKWISLIQSIAELNEFNRAVIDRSLNFFKNTIGYLDMVGVNTFYHLKANTISKEV